MPGSAVARSRRAVPAPRPGRSLAYPGRSVVLLGGIPGAGKSTLLNRLYGLTGAETDTVLADDGVLVVDSQQSRNALTPWLGALPYPAWRWTVHVLHYLRILRALRTGGPVIVHETATRRAVRAALGAYCRRAGIEVHLLLIDADPAEALRGQVLRGRMVTSFSFRTHERRWRRLLAAGRRGPGAVIPGARSLLLLDRALALRLAEIRFGDGSRPPGTPNAGIRVLRCVPMYSAALLSAL